MANLSWLYYKGYYKDIPTEYWQTPKPSEKSVIDRYENFFKNKHRNFTDFQIDTRNVPSDKNVSPISLYTTYPGLLIGSGYTHGSKILGETKIGFHLDYTTGMPIIPGTSVKGVLRSVFPQFEPNGTRKWLIKEGDQNDPLKRIKSFLIARLLGLIEKTTSDEQVEHIDQKTIEKVFAVEMAIFEGLDVKKSSETKQAVYFPIYKRDIFHDALPVAGGKNNQLFDMDSLAPHGDNSLKNPTPLLFLKVKSNVLYDFNFDLKCPIVEDVDYADKIQCFRNILLENGIGAKTNVGYGQLSETPNNQPDNRATVVRVQPMVQNPIQVDNYSNATNKTSPSQTPVPNKSIDAHLKLPSASAISMMTTFSSWEGNVIDIKKEKCIIKIEVEGEEVCLKKGIDKITKGTVELGTKVKVTFKAQYNHSAPNFDAEVIV